MAEGTGDEAVPGAEIVAAQNGAQARGLQQLQWLQNGQGSGAAESFVPRQDNGRCRQGLVGQTGNNLEASS
jgi:hypothetical protein